MTTSIPPEGNLGELPALPRDDAGPVFKAPWEAQAFAMTLSLHARGAFTWSEWAGALAAELAAAAAHGAPDDGSHYYEHWLAAFPYPYRLPGIGSGLSFAAGAFNIADTYTDAYAIAFAGDVKGGAVGVGDIHLIPRTLILDLGYSGIGKAAFQSYAQRGMNTSKDDFRLLGLVDTEYYR